MHTITVTIKQSHPAMSYLEQNMTGSRAVRNSANFLIRNGYTALGKKYEAYQKKLAAGKEAEYKPFSIPDTDHVVVKHFCNTCNQKNIVLLSGSYQSFPIL